MTKLEAILPQLYRDMHAKGLFLGTTWERHLPRFLKFVGDPAVSPIVDYGCGPNGGLAQALGDKVISYDPYVTQYAADPWPQNPRALFTCDVLEHMTIGQLRWFVRKVSKQPQIEKIYVSLSTRSANKIMPNGMNAHLTVQPPDWWHGFFDYALTDKFECVAAETDLHRRECVFMFTRRPESEVTTS